MLVKLSKFITQEIFAFKDHCVTGYFDSSSACPLIVLGDASNIKSNPDSLLLQQADSLVLSKALQLTQIKQNSKHMVGN